MFIGYNIMCKYCNKVEQTMLIQDKKKLMFAQKDEQTYMKAKQLEHYGAHPSKIVDGECIRWISGSRTISPKGWLDYLLTEF